MFASRRSLQSSDERSSAYSSSSDMENVEEPQEDGEKSESKGTEMRYNAMANRAKFIPLRLTAAERTLLGVVQGALSVSEYTDNVDVSTNMFYVRQTLDKKDTILEELQDLCQTVLGLGICNDYRHTGSKLVHNKEISENAGFLKDCMEVGRRYKIMNPDKMRSTYGKLLYVLMDAASPKIRHSMEFSLKKNIVTVYSLLERAGALELLNDANLEVATAVITADSGNPTSVDEQKKEREKAIEELILKYSSQHDKKEKKTSGTETETETEVEADLSADDVMHVVHSIGDNNSFLRANRDPVIRLIDYLKKYFNPNETKGYSLEIRYGKGGSKLSHSHEKQYYFVLQSLTLWKEIMANFFKLWCYAEADLLDERNGYRLLNTGQGLQRCQAAPRVSKEMAEILRRTRSQVGSWVGLSVVHLGDRDVPNALVFIDKYTQVPRILGPLVNVLDKIDELAVDPELSNYIKENFSDAESLRKMILTDYFRHAFDGSGDDGGSCIDGRLTSNWNWCSKLEKKPYYPVFLFAGFVGFDGDFRE